METVKSAQPWYTIKNLDALDSPALVIYPERVKANIALAIHMIGDVHRLRPHVKTHKTIEVSKLLLHAGITKFKCATIAEAEMLALAGAPDVLLAYQPVGPKVERFVALIKQYPQTAFSCLVDNDLAARALSHLAVKKGITIPIFIDVNVGMNRTGVLPGAAALALYTSCRQLPGLKPIGLHAYDGHINDTGVVTRTERCNAAFAPVATMQNELLAAGGRSPVIVAGGSATFSIHLKRDGVECSPGTFVFWDAGYTAQLPEQRFLPAALVITRIISTPNTKTLCTDLGHKAIASEGPLERRVQFLNAPHFKIEGHSEEHLLLKNESQNKYPIGTVLYGLPFHICPTCALYNEAAIVKDEMVTESWKIVARARKLSI